MTAVKLREWRGVKPVPGPHGVAITTRLRATYEDDAVMHAVAAHLGRLRHADLAAVSRPGPQAPGLDDLGRRQAYRNALNTRKRDLTALSSARWAYAIIAANDSQCKVARAAQDQHIGGLRAAIAAIERRLCQPTVDTLTRHEQIARKKARLPRGYATQAERFQKQRGLQSLRAELGRMTVDRNNRLVRVAEGGKRIAKTRHNLDAANFTMTQWRQAWEASRWRIKAIGGGCEPFGNLTITVNPDGVVSIRLPKPLEHLANARRGRYILSDTARFALRRYEWLARITGSKPVTYTITRKPGREGMYITASWTLTTNAL